MDMIEFRALMDRLELSQRDVGKLTGVTSRAVNLWATGNRPIPGPVAAYLRLLELAPRTLREAEIARSKEEDVMMKEGMYGIQFTGQHGSGIGVLMLENGRLYGADAGRALYDGSYSLNSRTGLIDSDIKITIPPDMETVQGLPAQPFEWAFTAKVSFPRHADKALIAADTSIGPVNVNMTFLRAIPET